MRSAYFASRRPLLWSSDDPGGIRSLSPSAPLRAAATPPWTPLFRLVGWWSVGPDHPRQAAAFGRALSHPRRFLLFSRFHAFGQAERCSALRRSSRSTSLPATSAVETPS